jgi:uncharacterized protein (TIGR02145 family)
MKTFMKRTLFTFLTLALAIGWLHAQDLIIHKSDGTSISVPLNAIDSITFIESGVDFVCGISIVTDVDGNVYNTVLIGEQCWMKENLKTTKYRYGTPIEYPGSNNEAWQSNITGAYAWYNNDINWKDSYGALYNWYAGNNSNGLCPDGWHVPSNDDLIQLYYYLDAQGFPGSIWGEPNGAGNALKSCRQVNSPLGSDCNKTEHPRWAEHIDHHGFDEFGFSALPGGGRYFGGFVSIGTTGTWWTSSESTSTSAWFYLIFYDDGIIDMNPTHKASGNSVRCLKDN